MKASYLKQCVSYDPKSGVFTWLKRPLSHFKSERSCNSWNSNHAGKVVRGSKNSTGYTQVSISKKLYCAHVLAWIYIHGSTGGLQIDHVDGDKDNIAISNLRAVTEKENHKNLPKYKTNNSGCVGVNFHKRNNKYRAYISLDGKQISLGYYKDFFHACCARKSAERKYEFHENHGRNANSKVEGK